MTVVFWVAALVIAALGLMSLWAGREAARMPRVQERDIGTFVQWPSLCVVVPARDEAGTLGPALRSLLASRYPSLEVVLVDDRSTDGTGEAMEALAADDDRVCVVHIEALPSGWLGKLNALKVGTERSHSSIVLFADADVFYEPGVLERAVTWLETERLDHLALMPSLSSRSALAEAVMGHFGMFFMAFFPPSRVNRDEPDAFAGVGAFNMVRRSAFERTEGWEWLRLEVADDVGLGYLLRRHGAKARFGSGLGCLGIEWYPSVPAMVHGLEKNLYIVGTGARFHYALLLVVALNIPVLAVLVSLVAQWHVLWAAVALLSYTAH